MPSVLIWRVFPPKNICVKIVNFLYKRVDAFLGYREYSVLWDTLKSQNGKFWLSHALSIDLKCIFTKKYLC